MTFFFGGGGIVSVVTESCPSVTFSKDPGREQTLVVRRKLIWGHLWLLHVPPLQGQKSFPAKRYKHYEKGQKNDSVNLSNESTRVPIPWTYSPDFAALREAVRPSVCPLYVLR